MQIKLREEICKFGLQACKFLWSCISSFHSEHLQSITLEIVLNGFTSPYTSRNPCLETDLIPIYVLMHIHFTACNIPSRPHAYCRSRRSCRTSRRPLTCMQCSVIPSLTCEGNVYSYSMASEMYSYSFCGVA
jgi:hypothetical protein